MIEKQKMVMANKKGVESEKSNDTEAVVKEKLQKNEYFYKEPVLKGSIEFKTWKHYFRAGGYSLALFCLLCLILSSIMFTTVQWWMTAWSKDQFHLTTSQYIKAFVLIVVANTGVRLLAGIGIAKFSIRSSTDILMQFIRKIVRSDIIYFDKLPIGMLLNRCLKDQ